ncbi:MAG: PAS domain S-box protein [Acidobacteria bacterium]|nr:PAS domain S-box protein [Acidobacteriota bacterium]
MAPDVNPQAEILDKETEAKRYLNELTFLNLGAGGLQCELRNNDGAFEKIFQAAANPMTITTIKEGQFVDVNKAFSHMTGYEREEIIGKTTLEFGIWRNLQKRDEIIHRLQEGGEIHNLEVEMRTKGGGMLAVLLSLDPIIVNNEPCVLGITVDITERKMEEERLKESMEYLSHIINGIGDPIFVKDRQHRLVVVNDALCAFAGKSREELLGKTDSEHLTKEEAAVFWQQEEEVFNTGLESVTEDTLTDGKGEAHRVMTRKTLLRDRKGNKQIVGLIRDITDHKRLEAQLLQAQKMEAIGVLAGGVAHDFNNLLTVIKGYTELLLKKSGPDDPNQRDLEQIDKAAERAENLTSQLLAFGRKQIIQPVILNLSDIIYETNKMLQRLIGEDIEIACIAKSDLGLVNVDRGQIQQIIMNLAVNARDAMPDGGRLTIEIANADFDEEYVRTHPLAKVGEYVMLAISDTGIGMDATTQSRIFEPFFTTKAKGKGTGLGLSMVYGIVKQSNGFIWVYSELGKGTTFKIYLPRVEGEIMPTGIEEDLDQEFRGSETILVAEDEVAVRALALRILQDRGYHAIEAADGIEALCMAQEYAGDIHLVLTDVIMPGMSGKELVSKIKKTRPGVKALYISGYTDNAIVRHGVLDPGVAFLQKPFTIDGFARKVRETIDSQIMKKV